MVNGDITFKKYLFTLREQLSRQFSLVGSEAAKQKGIAWEL